MKKTGIMLLAIILFGYAQSNQNTIIIRGEGIIESEPDLAIVQLGVSLQDRTADKVYQQVNNIISEITKSVSRLGIKKEDIKTQSIGLYPQYEYPEGTQRFIGYQMYHNLSLRIKDIKKIVDVIDFATVAGANTISSINFGFQEPTKLESQARVKAINEATKKAQEIAKAANLTLGKIIQVSESSSPINGDVYNFRGAGGPDATEIEQGVSSVRVSVTITYEIQSK